MADIVVSGIDQTNGQFRAVESADSLVDTSGNGFLPAGIMLDFGGTIASVPSGWLPCDGSAVSRTTYATLFTAISTTWGVGDGSTTFNLPDYRGRSSMGLNDGTLPNGVDGGLTTRTLATTLGNESHNHSHALASPGAGITGSVSGGQTTNVDTNLDGSTVTVGSNTHNHSLIGSSGEFLISTVHPVAVCPKIIKT